MEEVLIIGAGPCGLATAYACQQAGIAPLILEKGVVVNSIYHFPTYMQFFSTADNLEIAETPFLTSREKPTRQEALHYYRSVALRQQMRIETGVKVERIVPLASHHFAVHTVNQHAERAVYEASHVVIATGYYDHPNRLHIPGEELPKVSHYYREAHPYTGKKVAVIGGKNSAVDAILDLLQVGAEVSWIYHGDAYSEHIKPWVLPVFQSKVEKGLVHAYWQSRAVAIQPRQIVIEQAGERHSLENDAVLALTGYHPDRTLFDEAGVEIDSTSLRPRYDEESMETNVPGLFIAGVVAAGKNANEIFIENGRLHGTLIAETISARMYHP